MPEKKKKTFHILLRTEVSANWNGVFCTPDVPPATQPAVSRHWREHKALPEGLLTDGSLFPLCHAGSPMPGKMRGQTDRHAFNGFFSRQYGDDGVAVTSAGPHANQLHLTKDRQPRQHRITQFFTGPILFLTPNQQCQSTEGTHMGGKQTWNFLHSEINKNHTCPSREPSVAWRLQHLQM